MDVSPSAGLTHALDSFETAIEAGTLIGQLRSAREVTEQAVVRADVELTDRHRALLHEATAHVSSQEMRFADAVDHFRLASEAWRAHGDHANELAARMSTVTAEISALGSDTIAIAPLAQKQEHLLTALRAAQPTPRRLLNGILAAGYAALQVHRFDQAREYFAEAETRAQDDGERARVLGASALCELDAGHGDVAHAKVAESIRLARSNEDTMQLAVMLRFLTGMYGAEPDGLPRALAAAEEAVEAGDELGAVFLASILRLRGLLRIASGDGSSGAADLEKSIRSLRDSPWQHTLPSEVLTLGQVLLSQGAHDEAVRVVQEHGSLLRDTTGDEQIEAHLLQYQVSVHSKDLLSAGRHAQTAAELMSAAHHKAAASVWDVAAAAWRAAGDDERAQRAAEEARHQRGR